MKVYSTVTSVKEANIAAATAEQEIEKVKYFYRNSRFNLLSSIDLI